MEEPMRTIIAAAVLLGLVGSTLPVAHSTGLISEPLGSIPNTGPLEMPAFIGNNPLQPCLTPSLCAQAGFTFRFATAVVVPDSQGGFELIDTVYLTREEALVTCRHSDRVGRSEWHCTPM
jgi:hypothetical protein